MGEWTGGALSQGQCSKLPTPDPPIIRYKAVRFTPTSPPCLQVRIKYYECKLNLAWKPVLKSIVEDPEGFIEQGGWEFLNMEVGSESLGSGFQSGGTVGLEVIVVVVGRIINHQDDAALIPLVPLIPAFSPGWFRIAEVRQWRRG